MNALVASVIRTYTPIIVGQLAAWLILIHIPVDPSLTVLLTAVTGGALSAVYYTLVRVLEQQWPTVGVLLGLTASPDTYSKGTPAVPSAVDTTPALAETAAATDDFLQAVKNLPSPVPTTFPKDAVAAAEAAAAPVVPDFGTPVATPPVVAPAA